VTHIGIVVKKKSADGQRHLIVHNIGGGQVMEDCLFNYKIIGHYRYEKVKKKQSLTANVSLPSAAHAMKPTFIFIP
jgi:hypothetical protein